jgi:putative ABC transport system permease protein
MLATVAMLVALSVGAIAGGMALLNEARIKAEMFSVYDVTVDNPSTEEEQVLASIKFMDRLEYRYKIVDEVLYYSRDNLASQPPFIQFVQGQKYGNPPL